MTLFGNILQNPQDPRARSDVRLMNLVVSFLSMLAAEEENGGVKRMLGVCSEFERIAKVVLDKSDRDTSTRRKRKSHEEPLPQINLGAKPPPLSATMANKVPPMTFPTPANGLLQEELNGFNSMNGTPPSNGNWLPNGGYHHSPNYVDPNSTMADLNPDMRNYMAANVNSPLNPNTFQQPFVPPDLWQMPMTLEWEWADMIGGPCPYPTFENGMLPNLEAGGLQH
jgi:hypothetical protein